MESCELYKQLEGESFADYHVRFRRVDLCPKHSSVGEETQLKMVFLMGMMNEELVRCIIFLDTSCSLRQCSNLPVP